MRNNKSKLHESPQIWIESAVARAKRVEKVRRISEAKVRRSLEGAIAVRETPKSVSPFFNLTPEDHTTKEWWKWAAFWKDGNPVDVDTFILKYLKMAQSPGQREITHEIVGTDPYEWDTRYQQYNLAIGQGGGKNTYIIAPVTCYVTYKIANMRDPWLYFSRFLNKGLDYDTKFEMPNSSLVTERQAKNVHFSKMQAMIRRCKIPGANGTPGNENWFAKYAELDIRDGGFGDILSKTITIPTQPGCGPIVLHSFDSTPTAPEGLHIIWAITDEASRADTEPKYNDAKLLWKVINGNLNTRFPKGIGKQINFSYINCSEYDLTWELLLEAEEERKHTDKPILYATNRSTFEMNPNVTRDDEAIRKAYRNDPTDAKARYEGIKGTAKEGFYQPHPEKVEECFFHITSPIDYEYGITERIVEDPETHEQVKKRFVKIDLTRIEGDSRIRGWAFDAGVSGDAFILKGGYIDTMDVKKDELFMHGGNKPELIVMNQRPIVDIVIAWQPREGVTVDYLNVGDVLGVLLGKFPNSCFAHSDKYNSEKLRQEILAKGVASETFNFSNDQQLRLYTKLRWMFWNNIPQIGLDNRHTITKKGVTKTVGEWNLIEHRRLLRINASKVDHPAGGSKDICDVDAILCNYLVQLEATEQISLDGWDLMPNPRRERLIEVLLTERIKAIDSGIPRKDVIAEVARVMKMSVQDAEILEEYANDKYPELRE